MQMFAFFMLNFDADGRVGIPPVKKILCVQSTKVILWKIQWDRA